MLRPTPAGVYLAGAAAGPIGGDRLTLEIVVGPGAVLTIRSVAATVVLPGPCPSVVDVKATVAAGGSLQWVPEPIVTAAGCTHRTRACVQVEAGGRLEWREELVIGRHGEKGGSVASHLSVDVDGRPLLRHQVEAGGESTVWPSVAVGGGARAVGSLVLVEPAWATGPPAAAVGDRCAVLPLAGPGAMVAAVADDFSGLRRRLSWGATTVRESTESRAKAASRCSSTQNIGVMEP